MRNNGFDDVEDSVSNADTDVSMTNGNAGMEQKDEPKDEKEKYEEYTWWIYFLCYKFYFLCILDKIYWIQLGPLVADKYMCIFYENHNCIYTNVYICRKQREESIKKMSKGFALCVAYAANIGGVATLTGTPPNLILQGQANK